MNIDTHTLFSALANEIRLRVLTLLQAQGELCVCELIHALNLSQPMISRHLALLRADGLVETRRAGQWMYYRIHPELVVWASEVLTVTVEANRLRQPFFSDRQALENMPNRPDAACCA